MAHRGTDGRVEFFSTIARDISDRLKSEEALRESEGRYRAVIAFSPIGVVVSVDDAIVFVNPAILGILGVVEMGTVLGRSQSMTSCRPAITHRLRAKANHR